jgi:hypothetical protein
MIAPIEIRPALSSDSACLSQMINENAQAILLPHYNAEQWSIFIKYYSPEVMQKKISEQDVFCAVLNGQIVGTIALDKDFVVGFYTRLQFLNQGIGKIMMKHIEVFAMTKGLKAIQLAASPEALSFYYKTGWEKVRNIIMEHYGVGFEETLMIKKLGNIENLFSYGTLQDEKVQLKTFGRKLSGQEDELLGYNLAFIEITNKEVVELSGGSHHPIIKYTGLHSDKVSGMVFEISTLELKHADDYEVDDYKRIQVILKSGKSAWVYINDKEDGI